MHLISNFHKEDIHSVGLVFEPNFFTAYYYSDRAAQKLVGFEEIKDGHSPTLDNFKNLYPLYALTFSSKYTLLPESLFQEDSASDILAFNTPSKPKNVDWNTDPSLQAKIIFERDLHNEQRLDSFFPGLELAHGVRALLGYCRQSNRAKSFLALVQYADEFAILYQDTGDVKFLNSIETKHEEDVLYFVLHVFKTLKISTDLPLFLLGAASANDSLVQLFTKYFPGLHSQTGLLDDEATGNISPALHWIGIHADKCAL